ncbi:uncharacterized protein [Ptychodera flava]
MYARLALQHLHPERWRTRRLFPFVAKQPSANYYTHSQQEVAGDTKVIDLRSDTVTMPDAEMRKAMSEAAVGDDVLREDPTVNELEKTAADLLGKESALFVTSGTMGNLISTMCHTTGRGEEMLVGDKSHIVVYEQGGSAFLAGVHPRSLTNLPDGTFDIKEAEEKIRTDDVHLPITKLICLENTHNKCGGRSLPMSFLKQVRDLADNHGLKVHMDGARVMNAAVATNTSAAEILQHCDSVSLCLSKGLGAPVGSVIAGSEDFIFRARRCRKALGGGMRQAGVLAAAGLLALDSGVKRLHVDHENAKLLAQGIDKLNHPLLSVSVEHTETNMVYLTTNDVSATTVTEMMNQVTDEERREIGDNFQIKMFPVGPHMIRLVTNKHFTSEQVQWTVRKFEYVANNLYRHSAKASG